MDDYISFIEERDMPMLDFVMRPQSWFICDLKTGQPLVKHLFLYGRDHEALSAYLSAHGVARLPWLNKSIQMPLDFSARQKSRIQKIHQGDFQLMERMKDARALRDILRTAGVAAE
jgi:hypothetical protein